MNTSKHWYLVWWFCTFVVDKGYLCHCGLDVYMYIILCFPFSLLPSRFMCRSPFHSGFDKIEWNPYLPLSMPLPVQPSSVSFQLAFVSVFLVQRVENLYGLRLFNSLCCLIPSNRWWTMHGWWQCLFLCFWRWMMVSTWWRRWLWRLDCLTTTHNWFGHKHYYYEKNNSFPLSKILCNF